MAWSVSFEKRFLAYPYRLNFKFIPPTPPADEIAVVGYEIRFFDVSDHLIYSMDIPAGDAISLLSGEKVIDIVVPEMFTPWTKYQVEVVPYTFYHTYLESSDRFSFYVPSRLSELRFWQGPGEVIGDVVKKELHYSFAPFPLEKLEIYSWHPVALPVVDEQFADYGIAVMTDATVPLQYGITLLVDDSSIWISHTLPEKKIVGWLSNESLVSGSGVRSGVLKVYYYTFSGVPDYEVSAFRKIQLDGNLALYNLPDSFAIWIYKESGDCNLVFNGDTTWERELTDDVSLFRYSNGAVEGEDIGAISSIELSGKCVLYAIGFVFSTGRFGPLQYPPAVDFFKYEIRHGAFDISDVYFVGTLSGIDKVEHVSSPITLSSSSVSFGDGFVGDVSVVQDTSSYIVRFQYQNGLYEHFGPALVFLEREVSVSVPDLSNDPFSIFIKNRVGVNIPRLIFDILGRTYSDGSGEFPYGEYTFFSLVEGHFVGDVFYFSDAGGVPTQAYIYPSGTGIIWTPADFRDVVTLKPRVPGYGGATVDWVPSLTVNVDPKIIASLYFGYADQVGAVAVYGENLYRKLLLPKGDIEPADFWKEVFDFPKRPDMSWEWWNTIAWAIANHVRHFGEPQELVNLFEELPWVKSCWFDGITGYSKRDFYSATLPLVLPSGLRALEPGEYRICLSSFVRNNPSSRGAETRAICADTKLFLSGYLLIDFVHAILGSSHPSGKLVPDGYRVFVFKDSSYLGYLKAIDDFTIPYYPQQTQILISDGYFSDEYYPLSVDLSLFEGLPEISAVRLIPYIRADRDLSLGNQWYSLNIMVSDDYPLNHYDLSIFSDIIYSMLPINVAVRTTVWHQGRKYQFWSKLSLKKALHLLT